MTFSHTPFCCKTAAACARQSCARARFHRLGKIAALGIKVSNHRAYHGVALNVAMTRSPLRASTLWVMRAENGRFSTIGVSASWDEAAHELAAQLQRL